MVGASAPGKLILFGEHAVVFGEPAIAIAVDRRFRIEGELAESDTVDGASPDPARHRYILRCLKSHWEKGPLRLTTSSQIPDSGGLGSSAAVSVATLAFLSQLGAPMSTADLASAAYGVELDVQGRASPVDTSTSLHGQAVFLDSSKGDGFLWSVEGPGTTWHVHHVDVDEVSLVVGDTGIRAATGPLVGRVKDLVERDSEARVAVSEIGDLTREGRLAMKAGDVVRMGELMNRNHSLLQTLRVSHPSLDKLVEAARERSYGAKLTGAGGGGSMIALTDQPEAVADDLRALGAKAYDVRNEPEGVRIEP